MRRIGTIVTLLSCLALAGPAAAQRSDSGGPTTEEPWDPAAALRQDRCVAGARRVERLPSGLKGRAAAFPIGDAQNELMGVLYTPSYYDPARTWPVLVEGVARNHLAVALKDFTQQAETHGFILLAVEYLYHKGQDAGSFKVWSREGDITVAHQSRTVPEYLRDMAVDERVLRGLLRRLGRQYAVEKQAVAVTGFLGAGVMAYRLPMLYPHLFCAGVSRSGGFSQSFVPPPSAKARDRTFYIIFGDKEEPLTLDNSQQALVYLKSRRFKNVVAERIPNSGVDSRPEIAANYFRATINDRLGPERAAFDRAANLAGLLLADRLTDDIRTSSGRPVDGAATAAALESFITTYPRSTYRGQARFLLARVLAEELDDRKRAEDVLRKFSRPPLLSDSTAPEALLYLAERVLDTQADAKEVKRILSRLVARTDIAPQQRIRARVLLARLGTGTE